MAADNSTLPIDALSRALLNAPWAASYADAAVAGDPDAVPAFVAALQPEDRVPVLMDLDARDIAVPAFAAFLHEVWIHDHYHLLDAVDRADLRRMFTRAAFDVPFTGNVTVWRGTHGIAFETAITGLSWTTNRALAAWFACRYDKPLPLLVRATIPADSILLYTQERSESECLIFDITDAEIDGDPAEWRALTADREARRAFH
jgi:hypothetical protein